MKKISKIATFLLLIIFTMMVFFSFISFAERFDASQTITDLGEQAANTQGDMDENIKTMGATLVFVIKLIGTGLGIVLLVWFGIKWMTANPTTRAQLKEQAWNYVIGAVLLFGCGPIAGWIYKMVNSGVGT